MAITLNNSNRRSIRQAIIDNYAHRLYLVLAAGCSRRALAEDDYSIQLSEIENIAHQEGLPSKREVHI